MIWPGEVSQNSTSIIADDLRWCQGDYTDPPLLQSIPSIDLPWLWKPSILGENGKDTMGFHGFFTSLVHPVPGEVWANLQWLWYRPGVVAGDSLCGWGAARNDRQQIYCFILGYMGVTCEIAIHHEKLGFWRVLAWHWGWWMMLNDGHQIAVFRCCLLRGVCQVIPFPSFRNNRQPQHISWFNGVSFPVGLLLGRLDCWVFVLFCHRSTERRSFCQKGIARYSISRSIPLRVQSHHFDLTIWKENHETPLGPQKPMGFRDFFWGETEGKPHFGPWMAPLSGWCS